MTNPGWIGQTLNERYKIEEMLGQGGMSAVYKATDPNLKRVVAIKLIHSHLSSNPDFLRRFEDEARAVAQLRHPNIVQVYDFNHDGDTFYMVLEFVPGETLQARLRRLNTAGRHMPVKEALKITANICDAIDYAHQRGMIHRDIKPANIMLNVMSEAILMDFGIAKMLGGEQHTATGAVVGTALYMSPEQIQGIAIDSRSDIYSLGVTLYEMLGGKPPFEADSAMTLMMMHLNDPVPDVRNLNPEVPDDVIAIVRKALAKNRDERYPSAAAMAADLRRALSHEQPAASRSETVIEPSSSNPAQSQPAQGTFIEQPAARTGQNATYIEPPARTGAQSGTYIEQPAAGAQTGATGARRPPGGAPPAGRKINPLLIGGGAVGLVVIACLVVGAFIFLPRLMGGQNGTAGNASAQASDTPQAAALVATTQVPATPTETIVPPTATSTPPPSATPTITLTPTPTVPPGIPYVRINNITVDDQGRYVVEYETFEYTEQLPGMHVHFFFNTVPPDQAGYPGSGPWILYGGPRPFTGYKVSNRPAAATQMCALVANPNHSVQPDSGNCFDLPPSP